MFHYVSLRKGAMFFNKVDQMTKEKYVFTCMGIGFASLFCIIILVTLKINFSIIAQYEEFILDGIIIVLTIPLAVATAYRLENTSLPVWLTPLVVIPYIGYAFMFYLMIVPTKNNLK